MTFATVLSTFERRRKTLVVYSSVDEPDVTTALEPRNATIEYRSLPGDAPQGFVVVRDDGFVASIGLDELETILEPPIARPWDTDVLTDEYRVLYELLDEMLFQTLERRQLLGASREIENRAWRVGDGTLRVGFQRFSAFESQVGVYARLAEVTSLDVHVYIEDRCDVPYVPGVTLHEESNDEIGRFWFLLYDGGGDDRQACALLTEERDPGTFFGCWTYDPELVRTLVDHVRAEYE